MKNIFHTAKATYSYATFLALTEKLLREDKTTGLNQSDEYLHYAKLNLHRMHRWDKTFELRDDVLQKIKTLSKQSWWVITEGWCGDSAQCLPAIAKMADASEGNVTLKIILRDENPDIMNQYLTNGTSKSIPVLVAFDETENQLFKWGPRPKPVQDLLAAWKANPTPVPFDEFEIELHTWYAKDKGDTLQDELMLLF